VARSHFGGVTAAFQAEAAEVADASPTLAQPTVSTEMGRAFIPFSIEIGMDWSGFASDMARDIQDGKDVLEATKFAVGSGTNEPFGVITGSSASVYTASNTNSLVIADIYGVHDAMPARWRGRSVWVMNNATLSRIRQLDTAGGSAMLTSTLQARSAANIGNFTDARANVDIFGKPVYEASGQSGTFTTGQLIAVLGDFSYFKIIDRIGLTVETIPHLFATANNLPSGQRGLFAYWRTGSKILSASAFRVLKLA
jgi:HK97 family phage major capsid protein